MHCTTTVEDYCDGDLEQPDSDLSPSTSGISYDLTAFPKTTSSAMSMFYPHLNGYDIHPLLLNQRRLHLEPSILDPLNLPPHPLMPGVSRQMIHKSKASIYIVVIIILCSIYKLCKFLFKECASLSRLI